MKEKRKITESSNEERKAWKIEGINEEEKKKERLEENSILYKTLVIPEVHHASCLFSLYGVRTYSLSH